MTAILLLAPLVLTPVEPGAIKIDRLMGDWEGQPYVLVDQAVKSEDHRGPEDFSARVRMAYTAEHLFFAFEVKDDHFIDGGYKRGERLEIVFAPAGHRVTRFEVVLNDLETKPATLRRNGSPIRSKLLGNSRVDGWALELQLPRKRIPGLGIDPVPFAILLHDADNWKAKADGIWSSAPVNAKRVPTEPSLQLDPGGGHYVAYEEERGAATVLERVRSNFAGDAHPEQIVLNDRDLVILGSGLPGGGGYFYFTHGWPEGAEVQRFELMQLDGKPGKEILVVYEAWEVPDEVRLRTVEIYGMHKGYLMRRFAARLGESFPKTRAAAKAKMRLLKGKPRAIQIAVPVLRGLNRGSYVAGQPADGVWPLRLPWEHSRPAVYVLEGEGWTLTRSRAGRRPRK